MIIPRIDNSRAMASTISKDTLFYPDGDADQIPCNRLPYLCGSSFTQMRTRFLIWNDTDRYFT